MVWMFDQILGRNCMNIYPQTRHSIFKLWSQVFCSQQTFGGCVYVKERHKEKTPKRWFVTPHTYFPWKSGDMTWEHFGNGRLRSSPPPTASRLVFSLSAAQDVLCTSSVSFQCLETPGLFHPSINFRWASRQSS